jgi:patatin-like phospholipase/acyl hydrolase
MSASVAGHKSSQQCATPNLLPWMQNTTGMEKLFQYIKKYILGANPFLSQSQLMQLVNVHNSTAMLSLKTYTLAGFEPMISFSGGCNTTLPRQG